MRKIRIALIGAVIGLASMPAMAVEIVEDEAALAALVVQHEIAAVAALEASLTVEAIEASESNAMTITQGTRLDAGAGARIAGQRCTSFDSPFTSDHQRTPRLDADHLRCTGIGAMQARTWDSSDGDPMRWQPHPS